MQNDDDIFANERENSLCGTSQQLDNAQESTFQSYGLLDDEQDDEMSCDFGLDNDLNARQHYNECSLDNMSQLLYNVFPSAPNKSFTMMNSVGTNINTAVPPKP